MDSQVNSTSSRLTISVVIPVHNGGKSFICCLESLKCSLQPPDEIIVVADGGSDRSWQVAESFGAQVFRYPTAGGPARARNRGAAMAKGNILLFIDADVMVHPDTIQRVQKTFAAEPDLTALIGSYDDLPAAKNFLSQYKNLFHHFTHQTASSEACTFWGACGAIRKTAFMSVGGFDEAYRKPCVEDIELGYRLKRKGHSIRLCKDIQVKHLKCWLPTNLLRAEIFYRALPWTELLLSDRQFKADLNLNHANRWSVVLVFLGAYSLCASILIPQLLILTVCVAILLLSINREVYRFFCQKRGLLFALRVIPWHWFYFLYGGAAFAYGAFRYFAHQFHLPSLPIPDGICKSR